MSEQREHRRAIIELLTPFLTAYPSNKINEGSLVLYAQALSSLSLAEIKAAMLKLMRTCKFFPSVAEIVEAADSLKRYATQAETLTAEEAWGEVMELVRKCHMYKPWTYSCPAVEKAVKFFGGKTELCALETANVGTARAQFMRIFNSVADRDKERSTNEAVLQMLTTKERKELAAVETVAGKLAQVLSLEAATKRRVS